MDHSLPELLWLSVGFVCWYLVFVNELLDVHSFFTGGWSSFSVVGVGSSSVCASLISVFIHVIPGRYSDTRFVTLLIKDWKTNIQKMKNKLKDQNRTRLGRIRRSRSTRPCDRAAQTGGKISRISLDATSLIGGKLYDGKSSTYVWFVVRLHGSRDPIPSTRTQTTRLNVRSSHSGRTIA